MILVDDLLVKPFVSLLDILHAMAVEEMYDVEAIQDDIKENRLLYELGERPEWEYERRKADLEAQLETAEEVRERLRNGKVEVKR
ncbi:gas vesicle protein GvpG [halophilic archaeon]|uniref:gas vesicle protein GvpG n=1 Tax=Halomicrococcus sp. SG-WS-1 TaxID=3439057 RepID=UPI000DDE7E5C|nr:protein gvpG [halophilic archaeon]